MNPKSNKSTIHFDGSCNFCQGWIDWVRTRDSHDQFIYESRESHELSSVRLDEGQTKYEGAKAVFRILWRLGKWYRLLGWMYVLPSFLIDPFYYLVAKWRNWL